MFHAGHPRHECRPSRMTTAGVNCHPLDVMKLRMFAETARAVATGVTNVAFRRTSPGDVALSPGDHAPEFSAQASDGSTYRLADFLGRKPVVIAWFPKAFTGGCTAE